MKKRKKHKFYHIDPEKVSTGKSKNQPPLKQKAEIVPDFVKNDFRTTLLIILIFIIMLLILYFVQLKTAWLNPLLKLFKII